MPGLLKAILHLEFVKKSSYLPNQYLLGMIIK